MSCLLDGLKFICHIISEFLRLILFFASIFFLLVSILLLRSSIHNRKIYNVLDIKDSDSYFFVIIGLSGYLILLAACGMCGNFFKNKGFIEWFSFLACLNVLIGLGVTMFVSPRLSDSTTEVSLKLQELQPNYNWHYSVPNSVKDVGDNNTIRWNQVQQLGQCCGIYKPEDWINFRPKDMPKNSLPNSCCTNSEIVRKNKNICDMVSMTIWDTGCVNKIESLNKDMLLLLSGLIWLNIVLSLMACFVIFCGPGKTRNDYVSYNQPSRFDGNYRNPSYYDATRVLVY